MLSITLSTHACKEIECSFTEDQQIIEDYLAANNLTAEERESGLHYIIEEEGIGNLQPNFNSLVTVKYKGYFTDGTIFDENASGVTFQVGQVILGWQEGLSLMKKEGKAMFFIPSMLGYGTEAVGGMDGRECSVLIFEVEMLDFQ